MFVAAAKFGLTDCCCSVSSAELGTASIVGHTKNFGFCLFAGEDSAGEATASAHHCVAQAIDLLKVLLIMTLEDLLVWLSLILLEELLLRLLVTLLLLQIQRLDVAEVV